MTDQIKIGSATIHIGSNLDVLPTLPDNSIDSIVTDPPYELGFMGKSWDSTGIAYNVRLWQQCLRVLKPGGHLLAFGGSRTWHRLAVAIDDAGFEIRDSIAWLYGSGFPKSLNVANATDDPAWEGWGTALKPAFEPVVVGRKPLDGTVANNVKAWGVGGLNIGATRIGNEVRVNLPAGNKSGGSSYNLSVTGMPQDAESTTAIGRWPANILLDEFTAELLDEQADASRFFYVAKASKRDRNEGLEALPTTAVGSLNMRTDSHAERNGATTKPAQNFHPTVKPTDLMRYLIKLVTPTGGMVLDPFTGSGSTGKAAILDGYQFTGIELTADYVPIIEGRIRWAHEQVAGQLI